MRSSLAYILLQIAAGGLSACVEAERVQVLRGSTIARALQAQGLVRERKRQPGLTQQIFQPAVRRSVCGDLQMGKGKNPNISMRGELKKRAEMERMRDEVSSRYLSWCSYAFPSRGVCSFLNLDRK